MRNQMHKQRKNILITFFFSTSLLFIFATQASAQELHFSSPNGEVRVGDTFVIEAMVSSPQGSINVVDGKIFFESEGLAVKEFSTGGSIFNIWAREPSFSNSAGQVSFIGGSTNGFNAQNGVILSLILEAKAEGVTILSFSPDSSIFSNDGLGSNITPILASKIFEVLPALEGVPPRDEWRDRVSGDSVPPVFEEAIIARSQQLFDNKYFLSFFATDEGSGVSYYEVREGDGDFTRVESPFVLSDQSLKGAVVVRSVDGAGNATEVEAELAPEKAGFSTLYLWLIGVLALVLILWFWWRRRS